MASMLTTAAVAQTQTQNTSGNNASQSGQRNTSGADGLKRKGSANPGPMGSPKMQNGVSRNGNTNLSPTSQTNVPPPGGDKPGSKGTTSAPKGDTKPGSGTAMAGGGSTKPGSGSGANKPSAKDNATSAAMMKESAAKRQNLGTSGTNNGNGGNAPEAPMKTQGSTSEGDGSVASPGGAGGTRTKEARSVQPKSRAATMATGKKPAPVPGGQPVKTEN